MGILKQSKHHHKIQMNRIEHKFLDNNWNGNLKYKTTKHVRCFYVICPDSPEAYQHNFNFETIFNRNQILNGKFQSDFESFVC